MYFIVLKQIIKLFLFETIVYLVRMNIKLTQKQIGERITALRKQKGLSQEELAKLVNISRPSLTQIELGNRTVDVLELQKFAEALEFSLDDFVSGNFTAGEKSEADHVSVALVSVVVITMSPGLNCRGSVKFGS